MNTTAPIACPSWPRLAAHAESWAGTRTAELFGSDAARAASLMAAAPGMRYEYARQRVNALTLRLLTRLAEERGLAEWREAMLAGRRVNTTENRAAAHADLRAGDDAPQDVKASLARMRELAQALRARGVRRIVNLGIGGSDLGPRMVADALGTPASADRVRFVANVDPLELSRALDGAEPASTVFIVVSKTFTTQETMANAAAAKRWLGSKPIAEHMIAATSNTAAARAVGIRDVLAMPESVGGRFSLWSTVGFAIMCAIGADAFDELLAGARESDIHFATAGFDANVPVLMALLGIWNTNFLGARAHAVLPYAHALRLLPAYLQQLEMESNGKCVDHAGRPVAYATAPAIFGAEGTVGQHSFHQWLHQGTHLVPADFIVFEDTHELLRANAEAQAEALMQGTTDPTLPAWRQQPGNRASSTLRFERLDARNLGRLLAMYEHKVFVQGVIWNVNSFDQWGVELGKQMANEILRKGL
ncbi:MAG: glucose-6-phosphate isomerase [Burkholderiales bacterium]